MDGIVKINRRLELDFWSRIVFHIVTITFAICGVMMFCFGLISNPENLDSNLIHMTVGTLLFFALSTGMYFWLESKLVFSVLEFNISYLDAVEAIIEVAKNERWIPCTDFSPPDTRMEFRKFNYFGNNNDIVILFEKNCVLVNARGSYPTDKKIVDKIRKALRLKHHEIEHRKSKV